MIQTPRKKAAGATNPAASAYLRQRPGSLSPGGEGATGGATVTSLPLIRLRTERLRCGVLHLLRDSVDVLGLRQEVLEQLEQTLADRAAEGRRLQVGQVEAEHLRLADRPGRRPRDLVRVDARVEILVRRGEAAALGPDLRGLRGREILDERLRGRVVVEHHEDVP